MELELAGIALRITTPNIDKLKPLLIEYGRESESDEAEMIEVSEQDVLAQKELSHRVLAEMGLDRPIDELEYEFVALYKKILNHLIKYRVIFLHGTLLAVGGNGYLFMAPSGTGKSTHARLWRERYGDLVTVINDDKPVVKVEENGSVVAYGTPWTGKHRIGCNSSVPLKGIIRLRRGKKNEICELDKMDALKMLYLQTLRFDEAYKMKNVLEVFGAIVENVRFYDLQCNMEIEAAEVAYEKLVHSQE